MTMANMHRLLPCRLCDVRMAVPGSPVCTVCDAVDLPALVPDDLREETSDGTTPFQARN